ENEIDVQGVAELKKLLLEVESNHELTPNAQRDLTIMLHSCIGKISGQNDLSREIYRQVGHLGINEPFNEFANRLYARITAQPMGYTNCQKRTLND
ncbi:MAG: hypothetical protein O7C62_08160, partial [Rickettsia endosymbiont of Ixodes persulcatus]|nr:hypothetical protein [Rickettsia endosymbiont of Ixodes persulcatus]